MKVEELETPAVVVDLDVLESNIQSLSAYTAQHQLNLRPHTKTHKIPGIARMQLDSGCWGITVAKTGEAEVMASEGIADILVAYPVLGHEKLIRLAELANAHRITIAVDSLQTATAISEAAIAASSKIGLLAELDVGMRRCGVQTPAEMEQLVLQIIRQPNIEFRGLMIYPGHIWNVPDDQASELETVREKLSAALEVLRRNGIECEIVSGGSTPTARNSHLIPELTEIRPGTYVFNDRNTVGVGACQFSDCAVRVHVTVVSTSVPGRAIVDGGSKTFSSDRLLSGNKTGFGWIAEHPDVEFEAMSEEHGHLNVQGRSSVPQVGDRLSIVPNHVCACINMHDTLWFQRKGVVVDAVPIAGRGKVR